MRGRLVLLFASAAGAALAFVPSSSPARLGLKLPLNAKLERGKCSLPDERRGKDIGTFYIQSRWGRSGGRNWGHYLSWARSQARIHKTDKVPWRLTRVGPELYYIRSQWGGSGKRNFDHFLTWHGQSGTVHPTSKVPWLLKKVGPNRYYLLSRWCRDSNKKNWDFYLGWRGSSVRVHNTDKVAWSFDPPLPDDNKPQASAVRSFLGHPGMPKVIRAMTGTMRWKRDGIAMRDFVGKFDYQPKERGSFQLGKLSRDDAERIARSQGTVQALKKDSAPVDYFARPLYILEVEDRGGLAGKFRATLKQHAKGSFLSEIELQVKGYHAFYDVPCGVAVKRIGGSWPPKYECKEPRARALIEPTAFVELKQGPPVLARPVEETASGVAEGEAVNNEVALRRIEALQRGDQEVLPAEVVSALPTQFCVSDSRCFTKHIDVAKALYQSIGAGAHPRSRGANSLPVFCAPRKVKDSEAKERALRTKFGEGWHLKAASLWDHSKVYCSTQWTDTLGGWLPWNPESGEAAVPPGKNVIPPFACFANNEFLLKAVVPPVQRKVRRFNCRRRVFRILSTKAPKSQADANQALAQMCSELRYQTWGEKYPRIVQAYQKWCLNEVKAGRRDKSLCLKGLPERAPGEAPAGLELPFMSLMREELLYFFGHRELFCRADRKGLTHFLAPEHKQWAKTFTCGVSRGIIESGPFEEGVQACAIAPYAGEAVGASPSVRRGSWSLRNPLKARLHCWRYNRPTCEEISKEKNKVQQKYSIHRSNVFDAFDSLKHYRRTRDPSVFALLDPKDVERRVDWRAKLGFQDTGKDQGTFGVKRFCRFVGGSRTKIQCGFTKESMARWYELRGSEKPRGCGSGICVRGAYRRGYYCGLFQSEEYFASPEFPEGRPHWFCGIDSGWRGRELLRGAKAICVGGGRAKWFRSPRGDQSSLQCYWRSFRWGESERSKGIRSAIDWRNIVWQAMLAVRKTAHFYDPWLGGGDQATELNKTFRRRIRKLESEAKKQSENNKHYWRIAGKKLYEGKRRAELANLRRIGEEADKAKKEFERLWTADASALEKWARRFGHALGHRASLWKGLLRSEIPAIRELKQLSFGRKKGPFAYNVLGGSKSYTYATTVADVEERKKFEARPQSLVKDLTGLVDAVKKNRRPADHRWYQEFRSAATEDRMLRIDPKKLAIALRVHQLFKTLEYARRVVHRFAARYAHEIFEEARGAPLLTRVELHEKARDEPVRYKGNVFCVPDSPVTPTDGRTRFVCASSALLVAGLVELRALGLRAAGIRNYRQRHTTPRDRGRVGRAHGRSSSRSRSLDPRRKAYFQRLAKLRAHLRQVYERRRARKRLRPAYLRYRLASRRLTDKEEQKRRSNVKMHWCYGAMRGAFLFPPDAAATVRKVLDPAQDSGSPFAMDLPNGAVDKRDKRRSSSNWLRCAVFQYTDATWEQRSPGRERPRSASSGGRPEPAAPGSIAQPSGDLTAGIQGGDIEPEDRRKAKEESASLMDRAGGLLKEVINVVLPDLGKVVDIIKQAANVSSDFITKWKDKLLAGARKVWSAAKLKVARFRQTVIKPAEDRLRQAREALPRILQQAREEVDKAHAAYRNAAVAAVGGTPQQQKKLAETKAAYRHAKENAVRMGKEARSAVDTAQRALDVLLKGNPEGLPKLMKELRKAHKSIPLSSGIVGPMLQSLTTLITNRLDGFLTPLVRSLVSRGFGYVRMILDPIVESVIKAIGAIPFVGGALAVVGQIAYKLALNALEGAITDALTGIVRNFLAKAVQSVIGPIFSGLKPHLEEIVRAACPPGMCPERVKLAFHHRDRWLKRALACRPPPLIDKRLLRRAALARLRLRRYGAQMRRNVHAYVRGWVNRALVKYGHTYDSWMATAKKPTRSFRSRATEIEDRLRRYAAGFREPKRRLHEE